MSWKSGTKIFEELVDSIEFHIEDPKTKYNMYSDMIAIFSDNDCDNLYELEGYSEELDQALIDHGKISVDTNESEDWPDGGREDFS